MRKTDVYVVVDTPKKAKKLKRVLDMFGEGHLSSVFGKCHYDGVRLFNGTWHAIETEIEVDNEVEVSIKELRNILAKEHLKAGDVVFMRPFKGEYESILKIKGVKGEYLEVDKELFIKGCDHIYTDGQEHIKDFIRYATEEEKALLEPKKELEAGKWYRYNNAIINYQGVKNGLLQAYGFLHSGAWTDTSNFGETPNEWVEATEDDVKSALVEEANRRYKIGDVIKCLDGVESEVKGNSFVFSNNCLFLNGERVNGGDWFNTYGKVFENGQWADIIEQPQRSEDADKFTDSDVAIVERLHDTLLDNHGYSLGSKLLKDARMLVSKLYQKIK